MGVAAGAVPVPERVTAWGLPLALSLILTEAVRVPLAVGVKVTLIVHVPLADTELLQVLLCEKSRLLAPVTEMLVIVKLKLPVFVSVRP